MKRGSRKSEKGFTIMELVVATSVFGVMLLLVTSGLIQIGRAYYKGITTAKTEEITRSVAEDVTNTIQLGDKTVITYNPNYFNTGPPGNFENINSNGLESYSVCVGNIRYSYALDSMIGNVTSASLPIKHALWIDVKNDIAACQPLDLTADNPSTQVGVTSSDLSSTAVSQRRELLASKMRLSDFEIKSVGSGAAEVAVRVIYGDNEVINDNDPADPKDDTCETSRLGGQFCAFSELNSFVKRRK